MLGKTVKMIKISKNTHFKNYFVSIIDIDMIKRKKNISKHRYIGRFDISILRITNMNFGNV